MSQAEALERGYSFWQHEVDEGLLINHGVPYVPMLALVGIYTATVHEREKLTSYHWRHSVLESNTALRGLRLSLDNFHSSELDETVLVDPEELGYPAGLHGGQVRKSMYDGAPDKHLKIPLAEHFLAKHLGLAVHDDAVYLQPLRLTDGGQYTIQNHYPQTADYIRSSR
jgi:hypothetical protein